MKNYKQFKKKGKKNLNILCQFKNILKKVQIELNKIMYHLYFKDYMKNQARNKNLSRN